MEKKVNLRGEIFVIPNSIGKIREDYEIFCDMKKKQIEAALGLEIGDQKVVEIWTCVPAELFSYNGGKNYNYNNWAAHGIYQDGQFIENGQGWPQLFPVSLFEGKRDGDTIILPNTKWGVVELTLKQAGEGHRYFKNFYGLDDVRFEDHLHMLGAWEK